MRYIIEKAFNINVYNIVKILKLYYLVDLCHSVFCAAIRTKPITAFMEFSFANWL